MKYILLGFVVLALFSCGGNNTYIVKKDTNMQTNTDNNIYKFSIKAIDDSVMSLEKYKGKKILIVNVASKCGYTKQYEDLQALSEKYKDKLVVIGFPCNDFMGQEPGTAEEIQTFCKKNYGVTFPLAAKINVKGADVAPIYKWLCNKAENGVLDAEITWNFNKFLIDENGFILAKFDSEVKPLDEAILSLL
jgi:glutathione peroxidase